MGAQESNAVVQSVVHAIFQVPDIEHTTQVAGGTQHPTIPVAQGFQLACLAMGCFAHMQKIACFTILCRYAYTYICVR